MKCSTTYCLNAAEYDVRIGIGAGAQCYECACDTVDCFDGAQVRRLMPSPPKQGAHAKPVGWVHPEAVTGVRAKRTPLIDWDGPGLAVEMARAGTTLPQDASTTQGTSREVSEGARASLAGNGASWVAMRDGVNGGKRPRSRRKAGDHG